VIARGMSEKGMVFQTRWRVAAGAAALSLLLQGCPIHGALVRVTCKHGDMRIDHCVLHGRGVRQ
jgi:hypothetical protein